MISKGIVAIQFVPLSYHEKFPRAVEMKLQELEQVKTDFHRYVLLMIDIVDTKDQVLHIQKLCLKFGYRMMVAWGIKDAKELIDDFMHVY